MDESANKGLESKGFDAEIPKRSIGRIIRKRPKPVAMDESAIKGLEFLESNGSDSGVRYSSIISRMVVNGYDTSPPTPPPTVAIDADSSSSGCLGMCAEGIMFPPSHREVVEEALRKYFFASRGITLIHVDVPEVDDSGDILCSHGLIYVNEECQAEALKLDRSDMGGGRILQIAAYPFADNHLDRVFAQAKGTDRSLQRTLKLSGFDTSLASKDDIKEMVRGLFRTLACFVFDNGCVLLYLRGQHNIENALKLSGVSVRGFKIVVDMVFPIDKIGVGITRPVWLPPAQGNKKTIMATD